MTPRTGDITLQIAHTCEVDPADLAEARELLYVVFDDMADDDWEHSLGGMHAIAWHGASIVGHASVIQRRLIHGPAGRQAHAVDVQRVAALGGRRADVA